MNGEKRAARFWLICLVSGVVAGLAAYGISEAAGLGESDPGPKLVCVSSAGPVTIEPGEGAPTVTGDSRIDCYEP